MSAERKRSQSFQEGSVDEVLHASAARDDLLFLPPTSKKSVAHDEFRKATLSHGKNGLFSW